MVFNLDSLSIFGKVYVCLKMSLLPSRHGFYRRGAVSVAVRIYPRAKRHPTPKVKKLPATNAAVSLSKTKIPGNIAARFLKKYNQFSVSQKIVFTLLVVLAVLVFGLLGGVFFWYRSSLAPVPDKIPGQQISLLISPDESALSVLQKLESLSVIRSALAVRIYLKIHGQSSKLRPGSYLLTSGQSAPEIVGRLILGPRDIKITLPEGWRREQMAARLDSQLSGPLKTFSASEFIKATATLEGQLFPDTYLLPPQISTAGVIQLLTANFYQKTGLNPALPVDRQTLILASLVEREARNNTDRGLVASILKKRLVAGWPLQVDATVEYAMDNRLCLADLLHCNWWHAGVDPKYPSSFNTYLQPGLPPGAISNPGLATIDAVKNVSDTAYWYYLTDSDGITHYAKSLTEHNLNIDKYLKP